LDVFPTNLGCSAIFEYCLESVFPSPSQSVGRKRMGQVMATWDSNDAVFTDVSTPDLRGSTQGVQLRVESQGNSVFLTADVTDNLTWEVLVSTRIIF
jgi:hypothetical protein